MPITPDLPFPKSAGDAIRSKDWNDLVTETQRLDNAKVDRSGDAISGPLTIAGALTVGTLTPPVEGLRVEAGSIFINGEGTGLIVDEGGRKRVGLVKYDGKEAGLWRLSSQDFEIGRVSADVTALPGSPTGYTTDLYLSGNGNVGIGTAAPQGPLHVVDTDTPAALRIQSTQAFGTAQVEFWSDPQGSANEWRPGLIRSLDAGGFTGGLAFLTNGTGAANRTGLVEAMRLVNGNVGIGVPAPGLKIDVGDRIRLRQGAAGTAGLWLFQTTPNEDRAFLGMQADNLVGLYGSKGAGWGLNMDITNGKLGVRANPDPNVGLVVNATSYAYGISVYGATTYGLIVSGNASSSGRFQDQKIRSTVASANQTNTTSTSWVDMPNMNLVINAPITAWFQILVVVNGVQATGGNNIGANFRLLVDGAQWDSTRQEFHNGGWDLRGVTLSRLGTLAAGSHTISVQWCVTSATLTCCWYGDLRQIQVVEL